MFHFPDITSLLGCSASTELDLGCRILGYEFREKHDSWWKSSKMTDRKNGMLVICVFMSHLYSYYQVGWGVVQMVRYFKTSWSIRVIAPLKGHFTSELRWHVQNQHHIKRTICTFIFSREKKTNTLLPSLSGHFTSNMSWNMLRISHLAKKFPQVHFLYEIRVWQSMDIMDIHEMS